MDETKLVVGRYSIGTKTIRGAPGQPDETRSKVEAIGDAIIGIVAEGSGNSDTSGNVAQLVIDTVFDSLKLSAGSAAGISERIADAVKAANEAILEQSGGARLRSFGLAVVMEDRLYVGNVGGSRAYLVSENDRMVPLTQEHPYNTFYSTGPEQKQAFWMGTAELPLKAGDTVLLCSDGLVKKSRAGRDYVREQEFIESVQSEIAPGAARKIVRYAQGRQVDEAVSVVVMQHLTPERVVQVRAIQMAAQRKALVKRSVFFTGMAIVALAWMIAMSVILGAQKVASDNAEASDGIKVANAQPAQPTATRPSVPGKVTVNGDDFQLFGTVSNPNGDVDQVIFSGANLSTLESGKRVVVGVPKGSLSIVYLFPNSQTQVNFQDQVLVNLYQGSVYVQPGAGAVEVHLPQFQDAVARVQGSRMVVRVLNADEVLVQCFEGKCEFRYPGRPEVYRISVGAKRIFNMKTGVAGSETVMSYDEINEVNVACGDCINALLPTAVPLPPPGITPTILVAPTQAPRSVINAPVASSTPVPTEPSLSPVLPNPSATPVPPTWTASPVPPVPTATASLPATATLPGTSTFIPVPSLTPTFPLPTATLALPTATLAAPTATPTRRFPWPTWVVRPTRTPVPTDVPTATLAPTIPPTAVPTLAPTAVPTLPPTPIPSATPTLAPTAVPTPVPTLIPTDIPTLAPTDIPTAVPTAVPTLEPTLAPTSIPTLAPTLVPTAVPTDIPTPAPTAVPTTSPTEVPTPVPTPVPTLIPTALPVAATEAAPTVDPALTPIP